MQHPELTAEEVGRELDEYYDWYSKPMTPEERLVGVQLFHDLPLYRLGIFNATRVVHEVVEILDYITRR